MLRNEVLTGIQAIRHSIESFATLSDDDIAYFEDVLTSRGRENQLLKSKLIVRNSEEESVINHRISIIWEKSY